LWVSREARCDVERSRTNNPTTSPTKATLPRQSVAAFTWRCRYIERQRCGVRCVSRGMSQTAPINRARAAAIAQDTLLILQEGHYTSPAGRRVEVADLIERAVVGTQSYPPATNPGDHITGDQSTVVDVVNESTL